MITTDSAGRKIDLTRPTEKYRLIMVAQAKARRDQDAATRAAQETSS